MKADKTKQCRELGETFKVLVEDDEDIKEGVLNLIKALDDEYSHFSLIYVVAQAYFKGLWDGRFDDRTRINKIRRRMRKNEHQ